jgi:Fe-S-cluster containining protein
MKNVDVLFENVRIIYPASFRWKCIRCAMCCGDTLTHRRSIRVLSGEIAEIADESGMKIEDFSLPIDGYYPFSRELRKSREGECIFLDGENCRIYPVRPLICRFYPFLLYKIQNQTFIFKVTNENCPGVGRGKVLSKWFFLKLFRLAAVKLES